MYVTFSDEQPGAATIFPGLLNPGLSMHVTVGHDVDSDFDFDFDFDLDRDVPADSRIHTFTSSPFTIHHSPSYRSPLATRCVGRVYRSRRAPGITLAGLPSRPMIPMSSPGRRRPWVSTTARHRPYDCSATYAAGVNR